jgi:hypothetical protein
LTIERELVACLDAAAPPGRCKARDIDIVRHFYGFGGAPWPTLDSTATAFGVGTRERVRQIRDAALGALGGTARLPALRRASAIVRSRAFWVAHTLAARIAQATGDAPTLSLRGLLTLMHDLGLTTDYEAYDPRLERLTRTQLAVSDGYVLVRADALAGLQGDLREAYALSARQGLANTAGLPPGAPIEALQALLQMDDACWTASGQRGFWYGVDGVENPLAALAAKAFAASDTVSLPRLVEALANALHARSGGACHAGRLEIGAWITGSRLFRHQDGRVTFLGAPGELTAVERELVSYFSTRNGSDYAGIRAHLLARGLSGSTISKAATQSPVVHVDRSGGPRAHRYSLVGTPRQF